MSLEPAAYIVTFYSSHAAIRSERNLKAAFAGIDLIPVPREISSACGFCLLVPIDRNADSIIAAIELATKSCRESLWSMSETTVPGLRRKEKRYERIS